MTWIIQCFVPLNFAAWQNTNSSTWVCLGQVFTQTKHVGRLLLFGLLVKNPSESAAMWRFDISRQVSWHAGELSLATWLKILTFQALFFRSQIPVEFQKNLTGTIQQKATGICELIRPAWHRSKQSGKQKSLHSLTLAASEPICHAQWPQEPLRMAPKPLKTSEYLNKPNLDWCSKDDKRDPKTIA